jgi:hypothetical protein
MNAAMQRGDTVLGSWDVHVVLRDCDTGQVLGRLQSSVSFDRDGALTESGLRCLGLAGELDAGHDWSGHTGHGIWRPAGERQFKATSRFYEFGSEGRVLRQRCLTRHLALEPGGDRYLATTRIEDFDGADRLLQSSCATESGSRSCARTALTAE